MPPRPAHKALWAAALAVLLQLGAPVLAVSMLAQSLDPLAEMPLCSEDMGPGGKRVPTPHHGSVCPICQFAGHAGQIILPSPPAAVARLENGRVSRVRFSIAEPRAPPTRFAQARAPPSSL